MRYRNARILVIVFYALAVILFFARSLTVWDENILRAVTGGMFLCVLLGFLVNFKYLRCPKCGRVMKMTMRPDAHCPFCGESVTPPEFKEKE